jgi:hypothetical protein
MKQYHSITFSICALIALCLFPSCSSDESSSDELETEVPVAVFKIDYQPIVLPNDFLSVTPTIYAHDSSKDCEIKRVDYYWHDNLIESKLKAPFTLRYKVSEDAGTRHKFVMIITVGGKGYKDTEFTQRYDIIVNNYGYFDLISPDKRKFKNGETITFESFWFNGEETRSSWLTKYITQIYWDDYLIGETDSPHLKCDFRLFGELAGEHKVSFWHIQEDYQDGRHIGGGAFGPAQTVYVEE